ncbi:hypothetical protein K474DRAFT_1311859 [Panus rudis PR-1116 ss-1]|nr:hypothetical protein K474DRAFT_1311859 [Panus rudis PR-1116 ss-1]
MSSTTDYAGERSYKRARLELDSRSASHGDAGITPHETFWYEDGNVILVASNSTTGCRIHRSVLSSNSEVFKDMFQLADPSGESYSGCPVVRLPDTPAELDIVVRVMYQPLSIPCLASKETPAHIHEVYAMMRAGKKYQIPPLYEEAQRRIINTCEFDSRAWERSRSFLATSSPAIEPLVGESHYIVIVQLCRAYGLNQCLPWALYACCSWYVSPETLVYGIELPGGTNVMLSKEDLVNCIRVKEKIHILQTHTIYTLLDWTHACGCHDRLEADILDGDTRSFWFSMTPLGAGAMDVYEAHLKGLGLCTSGIQSVLDILRQHLTKVSERLPMLLGLS